MPAIIGIFKPIAGGDLSSWNRRLIGHFQSFFAQLMATLPPDLPVLDNLRPFGTF
jgi:hypothetical protein